MKINLKFLRGKEDVMISLFSWKRASHNSETLGSQPVSDRLGAFPWTPWSSYGYGKGGWGVVWGLSFGFFPIILEFLLLVACHQTKLNLIWFYFVNSLQSYHYSNSDYN